MNVDYDSYKNITLEPSILIKLFDNSLNSTKKFKQEPSKF